MTLWHHNLNLKEVTEGGGVWGGGTGHRGEGSISIVTDHIFCFQYDLVGVLFIACICQHYVFISTRAV